jgi:hypothetical protein
MAAQTLAAVAALLSFATQGNRVELKLDRGAAEVVWVGDSTFRFRRALEGELAEAGTPDREPVEVQVLDTTAALVMKTRYLEVSIRKRGLMVRVRKVNGDPLMADISEPAALGAGVAWERQMPPLDRFYGLGPRPDPVLDLRGRAVSTVTPLLVSSAGYGEYHPGGGSFRFDFTAADRYRVEAPRIDYYFYYGPTPKEVFQEHQGVRPAAETFRPGEERFGSWTTLRDSLLRLVQGAMSAELAPAFRLAAYATAPPELVRRARQVGSLVPEVEAGTVGASDFRKQLKSFYDVYAVESRDRGLPLWHPLPLQFPDDPECARHADEFMLGDEMLVAPIYEPGGKRQVYLPQGVWTNLETDQVLQGKRTIAVATAGLPVFARNGTIVPLDSAGGMALHYFPRLGAEFFIFETDLGEYSQMHAAPAADIMRLEIESKKARDYEWVVHRAGRPNAVGFAETQYREAAADKPGDRTWFYDSGTKKLRIHVRAKAGEDCIINIEF